MLNHIFTYAEVYTVIFAWVVIPLGIYLAYLFLRDSLASVEGEEKGFLFTEKKPSVARSMAKERGMEQALDGRQPPSTAVLEKEAEELEEEECEQEKLVDNLADEITGMMESLGGKEK